MNKSRAYKILGLSPGANEQEIRKRYKKLAMKVHPDINPDKNAHEEFILLSLAVECLLRPDEPVQPQRASRSTSKTEETPEETKVRMEQAKARYEDQRKRNLEENRRYFRSLTSGRRWTIYKWVMRVAVVLAVALSLDEFLPHHFEKDKMESYSSVSHAGIQFDKICMVYLEETGEHFAKRNTTAWVTSYPDILVETSWLLHSPIDFYSSDDFTSYRTDFDFDLMSIKWFVVAILLVPLYPYYRRKLSLHFVFLYQFSFWGIGLLEVYLLLTQSRLQHLLTFGFV